jgi:hypothetical protein
MKVLTTEQQIELQEFLANLTAGNLEQQSQINYWALELKSKRARKKVLTDPQNTL